MITKDEILLAIKYPKGILLTIRHPQILPYLPTKRKAVSKLVALEISRSQKAWTNKVSGARTLEEVVKLSNVHWTFQQSTLYYVCRFLKPQTVIETGVDYGTSSALILQALEDNKFGFLYSIDLPKAGYETPFNSAYKDLDLPDKTETGFVVPQHLRHRWKLILGDATVELPHLLNELGNIDMFFHDSKHTYDHMMFEFETAYPYIRKGGIISSDDVTWNQSFDDFCNNHKLSRIKVYDKGFSKV